MKQPITITIRTNFDHSHECPYSVIPSLGRWIQKKQHTAKWSGLNRCMQLTPSFTAGSVGSRWFPGEEAALTVDDNALSPLLSSSSRYIWLLVLFMHAHKAVWYSAPWCLLPQNLLKRAVSTFPHQLKLLNGQSGTQNSIVPTIQSRSTHLSVPCLSFLMRLSF